MQIVIYTLLMLLMLAPVGAQAQEKASGSFGNALVDAADKGDEAAINNLLKYGQYVDGRGDFGTTPLMRAAYRGNTRVAETLIKAGASVGATDVGGATPLHIASRQGHADMVSLLLRFNANANETDGEGWTPLMRAANSGHNEVANRLLASGANPNKQNEWGESALVYAVKTGNSELVRTLLSKGASADATDADGTTVRQIARKKGNPKILEIIDGPSAPFAAAAPASVPAPVAVMPAVPSAPVEQAQPKVAQPAVTESRRTMTLGGGGAKLGTAVQAPVAAPAALPVEPASVPAATPVKDYQGAKSGKGFMLQLGAFISGRDGSHRQLADSYWRQMQATYGATLSGLEPFIGSTPLEGSDQTLYRLRAGFVPDLKQAEGKCRAIKEAGGTCMVISPAVLEQEQRSDVEDRFFKEVALASAAKTGENPEIALKQVEERKKQPSDPLPVQQVAAAPASDKPWQVISDEAPSQAAPQAPVEVAAVAPLPAPRELPPVKVVSAPAPAPAPAPQSFAVAPSPVKPQVPSARVPETVALLEEPDMPKPRPKQPPKVLAAPPQGVNVQVGEAIPVPLSNGPSAARSGQGGVIQGGALPFGRRNNIMVEITAFSSQNAAIGYSETLKAQLGEAASGVGVRVTSPLTAQGKYYKLLMGPVQNEAQVGALCRVARNSGLNCGAMRELGASGQLVRANAYAAARAEDNAPGEHWLMLGAFATADEAQAHFRELSGKYKALRGKESRISRPEQRRSSAPLRYRLHAGPFATESEANKACENLERQDYFCTVI